MDGTLIGTTIPGRGGSESNGNERLFNTSQISSTGASPSDSGYGKEQNLYHRISKQKGLISFQLLNKQYIFLISNIDLVFFWRGRGLRVGTNLLNSLSFLNTKHIILATKFLKKPKLFAF